MKDNMKEKMKKNGIYFIAFAIPWVVVLIHSILRSGWLTGNGSILRGDVGMQYYQLYVELWNKVHEGQSIFYSWNGGDGFDFYLNFAYYLISPFTLLVLAVPKGWIENMVQVIMVLKWSFMAVSVTYFFMHTRFNQMQKYKKLVVVVLGCIFSMSNCVINMVTYFNWNDVVILFPLLLLQLEHLYREERWKTYYVLLTLAMVCNFYTAYQVCLFLVFWFILLMEKEVTHKWRKFAKFAGSSVLAAVSSMIVILPCILGVTNRYSFDIGYENKGYAAMRLTDVTEAISKLFVFDSIDDIMSLEPNLYISVGAVVLLLLYIFVKQDKIHKIKVISLFMILLASVFAGTLSYVWHGFSVPHGAYHRFLYLLVFVCCFMLMEVMTHLQDIRMKNVFFLMAIEIAVFVVGFLNVSVYQDFYTYLATILLFALYQILLVLLCKKSINRNHFVIVYSIFLVAELVANGVYVFSAYNVNLFENVYYVKDTREVVKDVELEDGERIQMLHCTKNMGMLESMASDDVFVSYCNGKNVELHENLGMTYGDNASYAVSGGSPLINLMFNIRYGSSITECNFSDVEEVNKVGDVTLYRMKRLAGLGYMTDEKVLEWQGMTAGPIKAQNQFVNYATGEEDIFDILYPEVTTSNSFGKLKEDESYAKQGFYCYEYTMNMPEGQEYTATSFTADEDMDLYIVANSKVSAQVGVKVEDTVRCYDEQTQKQQTIHVGTVKKGQQVLVYASYDSEIGEDNMVWFQFAKFNEENYGKAYEKLSSNVYEIEEMKDDYIKGSINVEKEGVMMTSIQAMDGFSVYVDGEEAEYETVAETMIAVPLEKGEHVIEFRYCTPYFVPGAVISGMGLLIFAGICLFGCLKSQDKKRQVAV